MYTLHLLLHWYLVCRLNVGCTSRYTLCMQHGTYYSTSSSRPRHYMCTHTLRHSIYFYTYHYTYIVPYVVLVEGCTASTIGYTTPIHGGYMVVCTYVYTASLPMYQQCGTNDGGLILVYQQVYTMHQQQQRPYYQCTGIPIEVLGMLCIVLGHHYSMVHTLLQKGVQVLLQHRRPSTKTVRGIVYPYIYTCRVCAHTLCMVLCTTNQSLVLGSQCLCMGVYQYYCRYSVVLEHLQTSPKTSQDTLRTS